MQENDRETRLVGCAAGGKLGVIEPGRVLVLTLPELLPIAEIGLEAKLDDNDVAFAGERLVVMSRAGARPRLHVVDPAGPTKVAEVPFRVPMRIAAVAGDHVLAIGPGGAAMVDLANPEPVAMPVPVRGTLAAAGPMGSGGFILALNDTLEEWDATRRTPLRRLRLGRPLELAFVGGHADRIWMNSRQAPQQVAIIELARQSSRTVELAAPPQQAVANTRGDLLVMICGEIRSTYIVDIARRRPVLRIDRGPMSDAAWVGPYTLALQPLGQPLELLSIPSSAEPADPAHEPDLLAAPEPPDPRDQYRAAANETEPELPPTRWTPEEISHRLTAWRQRVSVLEAPSANIPPSDGGPPALAPPTNERAHAEPARRFPRHGALQPPHPGGWRAELANWARSICARSYCAAPTFDHQILDELIARLQLDEKLRDAVALLYGAYLNGLTGVAPIDVAAVIDWGWDEAIGDGRITRSGIVRRRGGRVALAPEVIAALDGRPPWTGTIVGPYGTAATAGAIVAPRDVDIMQVSAWAAPVVGALLVPNRLAENAPRRFLFEAQLRGLVPLVPWTRFREVFEIPPRSAAILVEHPTVAAGLDLPVVATWRAAPEAPT